MLRKRQQRYLRSIDCRSFKKDIWYRVVCWLSRERKEIVSYGFLEAVWKKGQL